MGVVGGVGGVVGVVGVGWQVVQIHVPVKG